ncbi:hypothetical protein B9Z52_08115 [Limnohabitans sp. Jir72]|nr:hypothetical protein B9Z52_08115 [Limnohabitans sp. Jir72]
MLVLATMTLGACASSPWTPDATFGEAVRQAQHTQVLDATAPVAVPLLSGTDGVIAKSAVDRYQKSFEVLPLPVNVLNIGVGTGVGNVGAR